MTWALLIWISVPNAGGPTVIPGFSTSEACEAAAVEVEKKSGFMRPVWTVCVLVR